MGLFVTIIRRFALYALLCCLPAVAVAADLRAVIDISQQTMTVYEDGMPAYEWLVSTARRGYHTPVGVFHPIRLERTWYSRKYDLSPMPYSVFFHGGFAIHGTTEIRHLGKPVSHGCVRLHPDNARILFDLVRQYGWNDTTIVIQP
jgi:lipoprotein-anchoring transpeptidase ErfK/SrfK